MRYSTEQLSNRRWGIYADNRLLASIGCYKTCLKILKMLEPQQDKNKLSDRDSQPKHRIEIKIAA